MKSLMTLRHDARRLWPTRTLQVRWLRGVQMVRMTRTGWQLDKTVERRA